VDLRDFIVTPFVIMGVYALAYYLRKRLCDTENYRYFLPGLTVKIIGALAIGFIYQFYYDGGDTFNYHTYGSRVIWETIWEDPLSAARLMFADADQSQLYRYASKISFYQDPSSMAVVRIATVIDFFTFSSYTGTAVVFAFLSFLGLWCLFLAFYEIFPNQKYGIAIAVLFVPSVIFWGSGILKDTIVLACVGVLTYVAKKIFIDRSPSLLRVVALVVAALIIFEVKKYVLLCYVPALLFWIYYNRVSRIPSVAARILVTPVVILVAAASGYYAIQKIAEDDPRYALGQIAQTARTTAYDIGFYTGRNAGSGYTLGEQDGTFGSMFALLPQAVNVSLFRPYLWEAKNPLMVLSAIEATILLLITLWLFVKNPLGFLRSLSDPSVLFCLIFSVTFAFAVGVSTYNFGTLTRYRIPLLPFYLVALFILAEKSSRKKEEDSMENYA
jgi:hypothetical protein